MSIEIEVTNTENTEVEEYYNGSDYFPRRAQH